MSESYNIFCTMCSQELKKGSSLTLAELLRNDISRHETYAIEEKFARRIKDIPKDKLEKKFYVWKCERCGFIFDGRNGHKY